MPTSGVRGPIVGPCRGLWRKNERRRYTSGCPKRRVKPRSTTLPTGRPHCCACRRVSRRRRVRRTRIPLGANLAGGHGGDDRVVRMPARLPVMRAVTQVRQRQRSAGQGRRGAGAAPGARRVDPRGCPVTWTRWRKSADPPNGRLPRNRLAGGCRDDSCPDAAVSYRLRGAGCKPETAQVSMLTWCGTPAWPLLPLVKNGGP